MKVLHLGLMVNGRNEGLSKAFRDLSTEYWEYPLTKNLPNQITKHNPDIVFLQIQNDSIDGQDAYNLLNNPLSILSAGGAHIINWTGDCRNTVPKWMIKFSDLVDQTCFSNQRDVDAFPYPSLFLQIGFDPDTFKKWDDGQRHDLVFMGNNYGRQFPLGNERLGLVNQVKSLGGVVYGNYHGAKMALNPDPSNPFPIQSQESRIYSNSKIGVNYSHYNVDRYTSDRMFRMLGSGVMVLSHHYKGIEKDFEIGKHLDTFNGFNELREKVHYYLTHEEERLRIAEEGFKYAHSNFTYHNMVKNIFKLCES